MTSLSWLKRPLNSSQAKATGSSERPRALLDSSSSAQNNTTSSHHAKRVQFLPDLTDLVTTDVPFERAQYTDTADNGSELKRRSAFLDLPGEVRVLIYEYLVEDCTFVISHDRVWADSGDRTLIGYRYNVAGVPNVLRICRQIYEEAKPLQKVRLQQILGSVMDMFSRILRRQC